MGSDANYWFRESTEHLLPRRVRSKHQQQRQHEILLATGAVPTTPMTGTTIREAIVRFPRQTLDVSKGFTRLPYDIMRLLALI